jgi:hypothetical protein
VEKNKYITVHKCEKSGWQSFNPVGGFGQFDEFMRRNFGSDAARVEGEWRELTEEVKDEVCGAIDALRNATEMSELANLAGNLPLYLVGTAGAEAAWGAGYGAGIGAWVDLETGETGGFLYGRGLIGLEGEAGAMFGLSTSRPGGVSLDGDFGATFGEYSVSMPVSGVNGPNIAVGAGSSATPLPFSATFGFTGIKNIECG